MLSGIGWNRGRKGGISERGEERGNAREENEEKDERGIRGKSRSPSIQAFAEKNEGRSKRGR